MLVVGIYASCHNATHYYVNRGMIKTVPEHKDKRTYGVNHTNQCSIMCSTLHTGIQEKSIIVIKNLSGYQGYGAIFMIDYVIMQLQTTIYYYSVNKCHPVNNCIG